MGERSILIYGRHTMYFHLVIFFQSTIICHIQEKLHLKAGRLRKVAIACQKFKNIPVYEHGCKCMHSLFKEFKDALTEHEGSIGFTTFHDIVKLLTLRDESKAGLYR